MVKIAEEYQHGDGHLQNRTSKFVKTDKQVCRKEQAITESTPEKTQEINSLQELRADDF